MASTASSVARTALADHAEVQERGMVEVSAGELRPGRGVLDHGDLETLLRELPQVRLDAQIGRHTGEDHLVDAPLPELEHQIVGFRPIHLVRAGHDHVVVLDQVLQRLMPVRAGSGETLGNQRPLPIEHSHRMHHLFQRTTEIPLVVMGIVVVR